MEMTSSFGKHKNFFSPILLFFLEIAPHPLPEKKIVKKRVKIKKKNRQPEVAVNYSCLFFLSIYNLFINYFKNVI